MSVYFVMYKRQVPPFSADSTEYYYFLGETPTRVVDALVTFGGLLTVNPNPQREGDLMKLDDPNARVPEEVQAAAREMQANGRKFWVHTIKPKTTAR